MIDDTITGTLATSRKALEEFEAAHGKSPPLTAAEQDRFDMEFHNFIRRRGRPFAPVAESE